ncbi:MAG: [FeFe] hydrogenase H-cluster radical SAM maturase HydG [Endomicrobium sp.]|nr:[FeFe] hydrogenase H-cluster radical SAM maturase HydG [Endomicrobium sp.]
MKHIDEAKINSLLKIKATKKDINSILKKTMHLKKLTIEESAKLLSVTDLVLIKKIYNMAAYVKNAIYGKRIVIFTPLYISNICSNNCIYCGFAVNNKLTIRKQLTIPEIKKQTKILLKKGHKRILMVSGEINFSKKNIDYYIDAIKAIYSVNYKENRIERVNVNLAPMSINNFKKLKKAHIGTYQIFQETYHEKTYRKFHIAGTKTDPNNRLNAIDNAFKAGIDDVGIGFLLGLYDHRFEILAMLMHIEYLEKTYGLGPHTISIPRIEPAPGSAYASNPRYPITDSEFKKLVAILRLSVPYTGIIMSTRETANLRDILVNLGVSQMSAESKVTPGGYEENSIHNTKLERQFSINDHRSLDEVVQSLILQKFIPSFCTACYHKNRTGKYFMNLAKPGKIKHLCNINALITLKAYLDNFARHKTKIMGYKLIKKYKSEFYTHDLNMLKTLFKNNKIKDKYI